MRKNLLALAAPLLFLSPFAIQSSLAGGISGPVSFPSAKTLPKGVRNFTYKGIYAQGTEKYSNSGKAESLGSSFDTNITYQDLVNNEETLQDQLFAEAKINNAPGINLGDSMGRTNGQVNLAVNVHTPVFAYGINKKWTMAMIVPIVQSDLNVDVGSVSSESLQGAVDYFAQPGQAMRSKIETVQQKFDNAVQNKLRDNGYDQLEDSQKTELGDIQLYSKYNFFKDDYYTVSFTSSVTLPTGRKSDVDKLIDVGSGDEQTDIGMGVVAERYINKNLSVSGSLNYIAQLADTTEERIYEKADSSITDQVDSKTNRDLGDIIQLSIAGTYKPMEGLTVQTGYSYQYKGEDKYSGSKYDASNYGYLSNDTEQRMQALMVGVSYDTIAAYKKKEFMAPMEVGIGYTKPIEGKNVLTDGLVNANMSLFF